ncbi:MAG TPA: response regulator [Candidatus Limnocylindrales bacterium]|nr:response regulator [Candidatus Limnocylindrales bacterium]
MVDSGNGNQMPDILVVEDDAPSREGLFGLLTGAGYRVETAADGWQALQKVKSHHLDLAIIDLDLPPVHGVQLDGWDVVRILPVFHPGIAVIVVSGRGGAEVEARARELHVAATLEKPIDLALLKAAMRESALRH